MFLVVLTWVLGAGSLALFGIFLWSGSLGIVQLRLSGSSLIALDAALCAAFFLQHSVMIRRSVRRWIQRLVPAHCYGVTYTIASGIALLALLLLWQGSPRNIYALEGAAGLAVRTLLIMAFAGFFWGVRSLKEFDAFGIEAFLAHRRCKQSSPPELTIVGPYRFVRHPFYAFAIVALWAVPVLSVDRLLFNGLFTAWIVVGATLEERDLLAEFGDHYAKYRRAVPMLVPHPWRRTETGKEANASAGGRTAA